LSNPFIVNNLSFDLTILPDLVVKSFLNLASYDYAKPYNYPI